MIVQAIRCCCAQIVGTGHRVIHERAGGHPSNCAACSWVSPSARRRLRKADLMSACAACRARTKAKRNNLRTSSPHLVLAGVRRTAPQFCGRKFHRHGSHGCSGRWCSVRAFDVSRRGGRRPPPRKDLAQTGHALAGGFDNRTTWLQRSLQPGMTPVPITLF